MQPCECKGAEALVHQSCLNAWRTSGLSPGNLTRCEVCGARYKLRGFGRHRGVVSYVYWMIILSEIAAFFLLSCAVGLAAKESEIMDTFADGTYAPDSNAAWFTGGLVGSTFLLAAVAGIYLLVRIVCLKGELHNAKKQTRKTEEGWIVDARKKRSSRGCCEDCCSDCRCTGCEDACLWGCFLHDCCNMWRGCNACCDCCEGVALCNGDCLDSSGGCGDCGNCDCKNDLCKEGSEVVVVILMVAAVVILVALMVIAFLLFFWSFAFIVVWGLIVHNTFIKTTLANLWPVQNGEKAWEQAAGHGAAPPEDDEKNGLRSAAIAETNIPGQLVMEAP